MENTTNIDFRENLSSDNNINLLKLKNRNKIYIFLIIIFFFLISFTLFLILSKKSPKVDNFQAEPTWVKYKNIILGIEFFYPESWGEISTIPFDPITNLETVNEDFLELENNDLRYMVKIQFSENDFIDISFINEEYPGEKHHNPDAHSYGPIDNFETLKATQDICQYHLYFENIVDGRNFSFVEKDNKCVENIKHTLFFEDPDQRDDNNKKYYNYEIKQYFYKKLKNGFFDNLLIKNLAASYQGLEPYRSYDQVSDGQQDLSAFQSSTSDFKKFVETIKIFTPPVSQEVNNNNSIEKITSNKSKFGVYTAYSRIKSNKNEMVLIKNGVETIIDSGDNDWEQNPMSTKSFSNPIFSPLGKYLIYSTSGWEWSSPTLYNLSENEKVQIDLSYADVIFTKDEKYLISCTSAGIGSGVSAKIYAIPSFSIKKDFQNNINNSGADSPDEAKCSYSPEKSEISIVLSNGRGYKKTIKYNLINDQETIE